MPLLAWEPMRKRAGNLIERLGVLRVLAGGFLLLTIAFLSVAAVLDGAPRDLMLNLGAESFGAGLILFVVEQALESDRRRQRDDERRAALEQLGYPLIELRRWLARLWMESREGLAYWVGDNRDAVPVEAFIEQLPVYLGTVDFAAPGTHPRDRHFIDWADRSFATVVDEFHRWERTYAGAASLFDVEFRSSAEALHSFIRAMSSFLAGVAAYVHREAPEASVYSYDGVTELEADSAGRLVAPLRAFFNFYREEAARYGANPPSLDLIVR